MNHGALPPGVRMGHVWYIQSKLIYPVKRASPVNRTGTRYIHRQVATVMFQTVHKHTANHLCDVLDVGKKDVLAQPRYEHQWFQTAG